MLKPQMVLDPNTLSADGTVAVAGLQVSPDWKTAGLQFVSVWF
jgi:hypothetical protein